MSTKLKSVKIRSLRSDQKHGVAGRSLKAVLSKACEVFQLPVSNCRLCLYEDGTEVTKSYFHNVPDNTELILLAQGEIWQGYVSEIQRFLQASSSQMDGIIDAARGLLSEEEAPKRRKLLADLIQNLSENISAEGREEDEKWFEGVESRFKTKSSYMRYNCENRIRGYLKEVIGYASVVQPPAQAMYKVLVEAMVEKLKSERYNGYYFDRREDEEVCLCTTEGWFSCQGPFDNASCPCTHSINPYGNRESRILFSTWNLDHVIEKKRTVLPTLANAIKDRAGKEVNWEYFYHLLFIVDNLKLVHIACHKKTNHNLSCDTGRIYQRRHTGGAGLHPSEDPISPLIPFPKSLPLVPYSLSSISSEAHPVDQPLMVFGAERGFRGPLAGRPHRRPHRRPRRSPSLRGRAARPLTGSPQLSSGRAGGCRSPTARPRFEGGRRGF